MEFLHLGFKGIQGGYIVSKERIVSSVKFYDIVWVITFTVTKLFFSITNLWLMKRC